jgi:hypothetical protein
MSQCYEIIIHGRLPSQWIDFFEEMEVTWLPEGDTCMAGSLPDQTALYGLLMRLRDLGIQLVSVNVVHPKEEQ